MALPKYYITVSLLLLILRGLLIKILPFSENNLFGTMLPGMVFTIEPILSLGEQEIEILDDDWTAITTDDSRSAQFEHTVLITDVGVDVLTE